MATITPQTEPVDIQVPITEAAVRRLRAGNLVYLTGHIFLGRDQFHLRTIKDHMKPPIDTKNTYNVIMYAGSVFRKKGGAWELVAIQPTSSPKIEPWVPDAIPQLGLRAIISKGGFGEKVISTMKEHGCVYLTPPGGGMSTAANMAGIRGVKEVHWLDLGLVEATWVLKVERFGPLLVGIDAHGNSLFPTWEAFSEQIARSKTRVKPLALVKQLDE